jgi:cytochrome c-type biogenesis protein CcmH
MNAVIFGLLGAALLAGLLYTLIRTLRRPLAVTASPIDEQAVISIYQQRLQQVQQQFDNGELDSQEHEQAREELSRALAYELQNLITSSAHNTARPGNAVIWTFAGAIPLLAIALYLLTGTPKALDPAAETAQLSIPEMVARLEKRLKSNPDDVKGWRMLGRSYIVMQNLTGGRDAYGEAYKREPGNVSIILEYAEATARANDNSMLGRPAELIEEALKLEPANSYALILKGIALFHQNDMPGAVGVWKSILAQQGVDAETRDVVQNLLDQTQLNANTAEPAQAEPKPQAPAAAGVTVTVSLAPHLASQISPDDTVFVFAQAAAGPKMPLAVARKRVDELPLRIVLDDNSAMAEGMNISAFNQVVVVARVSKSGNASAASGDLQGKSAVVDPRENPVINLVIDTKVP